MLRIAGAVLLAVAGAIHLDLYLTGYRTIPVIGWLFLLQAIAALGLAVLASASRGWLVSAAGAVFALGTFGGYLLSVWIGLFGFREVRTTAGIVAGIVEVAAFAALALASLAAVRRTGLAGTAGQAGQGGTARQGGTAGTAGAAGSPAGRLAAWLRAAAPVRAVIGVTVLALVLLGVAAATAGSTGAATGPGAAGTNLRTATAGDVRVLTDSRGFTLYWFAPDTPAASKCAGSCAAYWPPVKGPATAGAGVPGKFGTIKRPDGSVQATYNGHPLYTYIGDSSPGQARGNNLNLNGGLWHEMTVSG